jgi:hypothetical protein
MTRAPGEYLQGRSSPPVIRYEQACMLVLFGKEGVVIFGWRGGRPNLHFPKSALPQGGPSRPDSPDPVQQDPSRVLPDPPGSR